MGYGKLVALVGIGLIIAVPLLKVVGINLPGALYYVGIGIIIIGALIQMTDRKGD